MISTFSMLPRLFHSKSLVVNERWTIEGSFNWLSATRDSDSPFHRAEALPLCHGPDAVVMIEKAWELVEKRRGAL